MSKCGKNGMIKILDYLRGYFAKDGEVVKSVNNRLPDRNGELNLSVVPGAQQIVTDQAQTAEGTFVERTTGGTASIGDGTAALMQVRGNMVHTGEVQESIDMTVTMTTRQEGQEGITCTLDEDTFKETVTESGTTTLLYTISWSANPATYGVTVTGTPIAGDTITIVYVKGDRGTITPAVPKKFKSTGWNLYNHTNGYARVLKYDSSALFCIAGTYTALKFSETIDGAQTAISVSSGYFTIAKDGYVWVTGGNATDTEIYMTWSDWVSDAPSTFAAYDEDEIDMSDLFNSSTGFFKYGLLKVGSVYDEIDLNSGIIISRIERMAYSEANIETLIAAGRAYEADTNYIYAVREEPIEDDIEIDGAYTANDHGMEFFTDTTVGATIVAIYGENLVDKLRTDVLTKSSDLVNSLTSDATNKALTAAQGKALKGITDGLSDHMANQMIHRVALDSTADSNGNASIGATPSIGGVPCVPVAFARTGSGYDGWYTFFFSVDTWYLHISNWDGTKASGARAAGYIYYAQYTT